MDVDAAGDGGEVPAGVTAPAWISPVNVPVRDEMRDNHGGLRAGD